MQALAGFLEDLVVLGVASGLLLRVDELVPEGHLEDAPPGRHEDDLVQVVFELFQQAFRQTDGSRSEASLGAVLDRYPHETQSRFPLC